MSTATLHSARHGAPRVVQPLAALFSRLMTSMSEAMWPRDDDPRLAAANLRAMANRYDSQPGFAADLRAAADRYEREHGIE